MGFEYAIEQAYNKFLITGGVVLFILIVLIIVFLVTCNEIFKIRKEIVKISKYIVMNEEDKNKMIKENFNEINKKLENINSYKQNNEMDKI